MPVITKDPAWSRVYTMSFANFAEIVNGDTIATVVSVVTNPSGGLTVGTASISGSSVQFNLSGGTLGVTYTITVTITTGAGKTLTGVGKLLILPAQG